MARTLEINMVPTGYTLTVDVYAVGGDSLIETITMTERAVAKTVYTGTIATASGADYELVMKNSGAIFGAAEAYIGATDGLTYRQRTRSNVMEWLGTTPLSLLSQQVQAVVPVTQKVDVETIKTNPVVNAGTITFPTTATLASTTNITAGTITTATNVTTVNGLAAGVITAASIAADAITDAKVASDVTIASVTGAVGSVTGSVGSIATGGIAAASFAAGAIDAAAIATDAIGSAEISAAAVTKIQTGLATPTNITAGTITTVTNLTNAATSGDLTATMKASVNTEIDTALADIHLDHLLAADYDPASKPGVATALLNELIGNDAGVSQFTENALELAPTGGSAPTAAAIADAVWDEAQADHVAAGSFGLIASEIADILVDTAEIGAAGAGLTNINLPNQTMDIVGNITGNLSGSVGSVTGLTASNLDVATSTLATQASVNDLPTNAELATALGTADDATLAAIAALNNLSAAQVNAEVDTALADVGLTTTRTAVLDDWMNGGRLDLLLDAIPTTIRMKKNTALAGWQIVMFDTSGDPATGKTVSGMVSKDGAAFGAITNSVSEISLGGYTVDLAAGDTNGNNLLFAFTATGCKTLFIKVVTQP